MVNQVVEKYQARMAKEGMINAFICALCIGFGALLVSALIFWLVGFKYPWLSFVIMAAVIAASAPLLYVKKFRPSKKQIAMRVDALGLKERLLTMVQLEGDDSYIAQRQREDAMKAIESVSSGLLKIALSIPAIVIASILALTGGSMATVSLLAEKGIILGGDDIIVEATTPDPVEYEIEFIEIGNGIIDGDLFQMVEEGQPIAEVTAIPDDNWFVYQWLYELDGEEYVLEETDVFFVEDLLVNQNMVITVVFAELTESDEGEGEGEGGEGEGEEESDQMDPTEGEGQEGENENSDKPEGDSGESEGGEQAGGQFQPNHSVIDGKVDYGGEVYDNAVNDAMEEINGNDDVSDDMKDIIEDYFDNIQKD